MFDHRFVNEKGRSSKLDRPFSLQLRREDLNLRPPGYAYHYSFRCPTPQVLREVCGLDFPFTFRFATAKVPAIKSLHLLQEEPSRSLARGYHRERLPRL